jgi:hypothetical protein
MDRPARLALAVKAQVASIRADQAQERSALLERKYAPIDNAIDAYTKLYGEEADLADHFDVLMRLTDDNGGAVLRPEDLLTGVEMHEERALASHAAAEGMRELHEAMMGDHTGTVLEWVSCSGEEYEAAVEAALND